MIKRVVCSLMIGCFCVSLGFGQGIRDESNTAVLPLVKVSIFSSGLACFEHSGTINGQAAINFPFKANAVNDALMSLVLSDPSSKNPSVLYQSEQTLIQTLRSLKIDLSDNPDLAGILSRLRGTEIEIAAPGSITGRIVGIEYQSLFNPMGGGHTMVPWLSVYTEKGIQRFNLGEINSISFKDPQISDDLNRALNLIASSRNYETRDLTVKLPGTGSRPVAVSYVIPAPVWKVSYRLDLGGTKPLLQGWAIVDNDSDTDWSNVQLSLVTGRPSSFIQNLYPPYYVSRPVLPLAIAGTADAVTHDTGYGAPVAAPMPQVARSSSQLMMSKDSTVEYAMAAESGVTRNALAGSAVETAAGAAAGDQFEFTIKNPVSLDRRMSVMLPLVESAINARKLLIFSGANARSRSINPRIGAELTNTSGMKLPAGPITVYDGGTYAGDALIEFWNEGEKRLISFGDDLSVSGAVMDTSARSLVSVTVAGGLMTFNRSQEFTKTYTFKNTAAQLKSLVVEHPKTSETTLASPQADEQTASAYRFTVTLPAEKEYTFIVRETRPVQERVSLLQLRQDSFLYYASNQEIPPRVREALQQAVRLRTAVNAADAAVLEAESRRSYLVSEQERIRKNIEAAGNQTQQGQEYLRRLLELDTQIDTLAPQIDKLRADAKNAQKSYEDYLNGLNL